MTRILICDDENQKPFYEEEVLRYLKGALSLKNDYTADDEHYVCFDSERAAIIADAENRAFDLIFVVEDHLKSIGLSVSYLLQRLVFEDATVIVLNQNIEREPMFGPKPQQDGTFHISKLHPDTIATKARLCVGGNEWPPSNDFQLPSDLGPDNGGDSGVPRVAGPTTRGGGAQQELPTVETSVLVGIATNHGLAGGPP